MHYRQQPQRKMRHRAGFSLAEMIVTIAVIGIMTAIAVKVFVNVKKGSQDILANQVMEAVNLGVKKFAQGNYKITTAADPDSTADEATVLGLLQTRDDSVPGTPFVRPDWDPIASSSEEDYRIQWAGQVYVMLKPGVAGQGIKVNFQATDYN
jgi:prepilin-type N-terminal cleavage/methylation domain-containing protein